MTLLGFDRIQAAQKVLSARLTPTPLVPVCDEKLVGELWLKCESLQPTGSFKIRGATYRISQLSSQQKAAGVVAYSTGNHAQAIAKAAADAGIASTIVMSPDVPSGKVLATKRWGAQIRMAEPNSNARRAMAEALAASTGATLIPPYNDFDVMAGQGTIACELASQITLAKTTVFVPIGGGGLIAGVAAGLKSIAPACRVVGVEPELENDAALSFKRGSIVSATAPSESIADAIKVQALGELTFPTIQMYVDDIITVSEREILSATLDLLQQQHLLVEPGGAVAYAAARSHACNEGGVYIALLCGGNITLERLEMMRRQEESL